MTGRKRTRKAKCELCGERITGTITRVRVKLNDAADDLLSFCGREHADAWMGHLREELGGANHGDAAGRR